MTDAELFEQAVACLESKGAKKRGDPFRMAGYTRQRLAIHGQDINVTMNTKLGLGVRVWAAGCGQIKVGPNCDAYEALRLSIKEGAKRTLDCIRELEASIQVQIKARLLMLDLYSKLR